MKHSIAVMFLATCLCAASTVEKVRAQQTPAVATLLSPSAAPNDANPEITTIELQLDELTQRPDANVAKSLIDTATRALQRARVLLQQNDVASAERVKQIAWAALSAASHTIARHQAERELAALQRRKTIAEQARAAAREALEHARVQHASVVASPEPTSTEATSPAEATP